MRIFLFLLVLSHLMMAQNKVVYTIRCIEKSDSLAPSSAERKIELNKDRKMLTSVYLTASDDRKRNTVQIRYDKKGRILQKEEYAWSNYFLESYKYKKNVETEERKFNTTNSTRVKIFRKGKLMQEQVYHGMKTYGDSLKLSYTIQYKYDSIQKENLIQMLYFRAADTAWFEKIDHRYDKNKLVRIDHYSREQQLDYRELKYDEEGRLVEEGFWDIKHPANWEQLKYVYHNHDTKEVLRSNIYIEEWTLFEKGEIRRRKIYDITSEGVLLRQFEEYIAE